MSVVQNLIIIYTGAVVINLALSVIVWARQREELHRQLILLWGATLLSGLVQGAAASAGTFLVALAFSSCFLINLALAAFIASAAGCHLRIRVHVLLNLGAIAVAAAVALMSDRFLLVSLPIALAVTSPILSVTEQIVRRRAAGLTTTSIALVVNALLLCLHNVDFPFLRSSPELAPVGFTVALFILFGLSVTTYSTALERVSAERAAIERLDKFKSRFFANITHELRTPLTMIMAPLEELLAGDADPVTPQQRRYLAAIGGQAMRLLKSINDILDLSKLEEGRFSLEVQQFDLSALVSDVIEYSGPLAARKRVTLEVRLPDQPVEIYADAPQLERVLVNLLANALKFTASGGAVELAVELQDKWVALSVSDTGCGIPPDRIDSVFERFSQGDDRVARRFGGSGIGLAFVQEIVELHRGEISLRSELDRGTVVTVRLLQGYQHMPSEWLANCDPTDPSDIRLVGEPREWTKQLLARPDYRFMDIEQAAERRRVRRSSTISAATRVLVVDDNLEILRFVEMLLGSTYAVYVAEDGRQGLAVAGREYPDLLITDYQMPAMNGIELVKAVRADPKLANIPVIMLTGKGDAQSRTEVRRSGADVYLRKPFSPRELRAAIAQLLDKRGKGVEIVADAQANTLLSISAGLAHEINNPLSYIRNSLVVIRQKTDLILSRESSGEPDPAIDQARDRIARMMAVADRGVAKISTVVELLRRYAREGYPQTPSPVVFDDAVREVVSMLMTRQGRATVLASSLKAHASVVECIPEEMNQVIGNLVQNALDAAETEVNVRTACIGGRVVLEVIDDGPGLPRELESKIFTPFFSTKEPGNGMGLGLSIARQVVSRCGGTISGSARPAGGTVFRVELPVSG